MKRSSLIPGAEFAVLAYLIAVPITAHLPDDIAQHDFSRIAQLLLLLFCSARLVLDQTFAAPLRIRNTAATAALVAAALAIAALLAAPDRMQATREVALVLGLGGVIAAMAASDLRAPQRWVVGTIAAAASYTVLVVILLVAARVSNESLLLSELFSGYDNHRFYSHVQTVVLPLLAIATNSRVGSRGVRGVAWLAGVLGFALLIAGAGRATALALFIAGGVGVCLFGPATYKWLRHLGLAAALGAVVYVLGFVLVPTMLGSVSSPVVHQEILKSDHSRFYLWQLALEYVQQSPWLGIGPMHYAHYPNMKAAHPHNVYLQIAAEWGVPMLLVVLAVASCALQRFYRAICSCGNEDQKSAGVGLFCTCIAVAVDGFFSGNFVIPMSQVWIALLIGWSIHWIRIQVRRPIAVPRSAWSVSGIAIAVVLLLSQGWLVLSAYAQAHRTAQQVKSVQHTPVDSQRNNPRFWAHGWF